MMSHSETEELTPEEKREGLITHWQQLRPMKSSEPHMTRDELHERRECKEIKMSLTITATYSDGVLKPSEPLDLLPQTTVQVTIDELPKPTAPARTNDQVLAMLEHIWSQSKDFSSAPRMTRDELHERD